MTTKKQPDQQSGGGEKQRRSRSLQPGSIQGYDTDQGKRWRFQIYVLKDPEYPEMGSRGLTRSGFTSTDEANDALQEALKQRKQNEKFSGKVPTVGAYADEWAAGLKLAASTSEVRAQKPEIATWTAEQFALFLTWNRDVLEDELFPLWRLIAYTGMRRSEALVLKWSDIDSRAMRVSIRRAVDIDDWTKTKPPKAGNARVIDVDAETLKVLASYKVARAEVSFELAKADAYVFGDDHGKLRSPDAMTSRWDRRLK